MQPTKNAHQIRHKLHLFFSAQNHPCLAPIKKRVCTHTHTHTRSRQHREFPDARIRLHLKSAAPNHTRALRVLKAYPPAPLFFPFPSCITHPHPHPAYHHTTTTSPSTSINTHNTPQQWLAPSRLPASPLVARLPASSLPPRPPARAPPLPVASRSLTATSPVPSLSVRSVATRSRLSSSSASSPSSAW